MKMRKEKKVRLCVDFDKAENLARFVMALKEAGILDLEAGVFRVESLDFMRRMGGVGRADTYIVLKPEAAEKRERFIYTKEVTI